MTEIIVATKNKGKFEEIGALLEKNGLCPRFLLTFPDVKEITEDGITFRENAIKKALTVSQMTGILTVADDSGLVVDALDGKPGVYSSRFAGTDATDEKNNRKLLALLEGIPEAKRDARFICVTALADKNGLIDVVEGVCEGIIAEKLKGNKGFGYDPLFICRGYNKTFAELPRKIKNCISHRAKALKKIIGVIKRYINENALKTDFGSN